jgi:hypothetical protein
MNTNSIKKAFLFALTIVAFSGCSEWREVESIDFTKIDLNGTSKTDEYYASLREWKNTPGLPQTFVWFDNWTGTSPTGDNSLRGLPDSVTIASNWGGHPKFDLSPERRADMEYVQKVKGTKVVVTLFSAKVGDDMPADPDWQSIGTSSDENVIRPVIRKYAEAIYDAVIASGYDGYDWDFEPTVSGQSTAQAPLWRVPAQRTIFVEELSYWFGSGATEPGRDRGGRKPAQPGLLFLIDGEVGGSYASQMDLAWPFHYVDYFVHQAYGTASISGCETRVSGTVNRLVAANTPLSKEEIVRRCILTENFESYAGSGGGILVQSSYIYAPTSGANLGVNQQIGGFGIYRSVFDYNQGKGDYNGSPEYYFLRQGITNIYQLFNERKNAPAPQP